MSYSEFTLDSACRAFHLSLNQDVDLFSETPETSIGPLLQATLEENVSLATSINTEKARSELIVAPVLVEVRRQAARKISLFSGIIFDVEPEKGLNDVCDFILARSPDQLFLKAPVLTVVEAKNDNVKSGLGQCVAEMIASRIFNVMHHEGPFMIHGVVTTGSLWQFLRLDQDIVYVDRPEYYLDRLGKILGIILACAQGRSDGQGSLSQTGDH